MVENIGYGIRRASIITFIYLYQEPFFFFSKIKKQKIIDVQFVCIHKMIKKK